VKHKIGSPDYSVNWSPYLLGVIEASLSKISWENFVLSNKSLKWTLVHGDFHPANVLIRGDGQLLIVDWEQVGVGSGPQDLGQYAISHMPPTTRR